MKFISVGLIGIVNLLVASAFRVGRIGRFGNVLRLSAASDPAVVEAYAQVKSQIKSVISSKFVNGVPAQFNGLLNTFLDEYGSSNIEAGKPPKVFMDNVVRFFESVKSSMEDPFKFQPFHKAVREPFDYYKWGNEFLKPMVVLDKSRVEGLANAKKIEELLAKGENVMILSNHQTEADPQVISILLEANGLSSLAEKMIFVAGHKVTTDPVAIPFSMGRNLLCIHSKKHIKNPPEQAAVKQQQNLATMDAMAALAKEGGNVFWVAPSGGRDRPDETTGQFVVAPFDPKAVDMFKIIGMQSGKPMHFFPMAMYTHQLVPPPKSVSSSVGEERSGKRGPVSINFLDETDGLGAVGDKSFVETIENRVKQAFEAEVEWHAKNA